MRNVPHHLVEQFSFFADIGASFLVIVLLVLVWYGNVISIDTIDVFLYTQLRADSSLDVHR
jgi:hypothetical protein